jgi:hypothetical protein
VPKAEELVMVAPSSCWSVHLDPIAKEKAGQRAGRARPWLRREAWFRASWRRAAIALGAAECLCPILFKDQDGTGQPRTAFVLHSSLLRDVPHS